MAAHSRLFRPHSGALRPRRGVSASRHSFAKRPPPLRSQQSRVALLLLLMVVLLLLLLLLLLVVVVVVLVLLLRLLPVLSLPLVALPP